MSNSQILRYFTQGSDEITENDKLYEFVLKPEVVFLHIENLPIVVGWHAIIYTLNHPVYGVGKVRAGWVLNAWEDDNHNVVRFETKDAYYVVASGDDDAQESLVSVTPLRPQDKDGTTASVECVA